MQKQLKFDINVKTHRAIGGFGFLLESFVFFGRLFFFFLFNSEFYYDTMANAILGNNRVALVPGNNPFFNYFMGVKYVMARKDNLPDSYDIKYEKNVCSHCE